MQHPLCGKLIKNLHRFRLITFDITDTLIGFRYPVNVQYKMIAQEFGVTDLDEQSLQTSFRREFKLLANLHPNFGAATQMPWQQWWLQLVENVFASVTPELPKEKRLHLASTLVHKYRTSSCWYEKEGGRELIGRIRASGNERVVGVISNYDDGLELVLRDMNLAELFDFVLTSYSAGVQKPDKGIFDLAVRKCNVRPNEALHIGNSYELDYIGARNAGWASLLVTNDSTSTPPVPQAYSNLNELLAALDTQDFKWL